MNYTNEIVSKKIKEERLKKNLSQKELGELLNVSNKQVSNYENEKFPMPHITVLGKLCEIFDCELGYLLGEEDYENKTRLQTEILRATGLTQKSYDNLHLITSGINDIDSYENARIANSVFSSSLLLNVFYALQDLDNAFGNLNAINDKLSLLLEEELYANAFEIYNSNGDYIHSNIPNNITHAITTIDSYVNEQLNAKDAIKLCRYELAIEFENLIQSIYPRL